MAKGKVTSKAEKERYARYKATNQYSKNKVRKIARHLKKYPEDTVAAAAIKRTPFSYSRRTPKAPKWSKSEKALVTLLASKIKGPKTSQVAATLGS